ncbi:MAG TPA: hypothetical protein VFX44_08820 [Solirubrobacterales bacterium]|nr:hypothetical protein [Solirubrobacterales bacterium]
MKSLKLSIFAMAMATAFAALSVAGASATTLKGAEGKAIEAGTTISAESEGHAVLDAPIGKLECNSAVSGKTENAGGSTETVKGPIESLSFTNCTSGVVPTVITKGTLEIHTSGETANDNGTLTSNGTEVTVEAFGFHCIFKTTNTDIGTVTGSATTGGSATLDISATIPRSGGRAGAFCGSSAPWTGSYKVTTPSTLNVDSAVVLSGEAPTGSVGETSTVTWKDTGNESATIADEPDSNEAVAKTVGTACATIAAGGSCTNRKFECLKEGEATLTIRDTTHSAVGEVKIKCDLGKITGEVGTGTIGETNTVTWKNTGVVPVTIEDELDSESAVAETLGSGCGTIAAGGSCTSRKVKCLKEGEATLTARDTPSVEGKVTIKCDKPVILKGSVPTPDYVGETYTVTWKNEGSKSATVADETNSAETVVETTGTACTTIASEGSCTTRKVKCLKAGEATLTARDTTNSAEGSVTIKCENPPVILKGKVTTPGVVGETYTVTWENTGTGTATISDETNSSSTVAETTGTACTTIAGSSSCTNRKVKCLKVGESTLTVRDTTNSAEASVTIKCVNALEGGPSTGKVGETVTVTWTNNGESALVIEDESTSDGTVAETLGTSCGTIAATSSCTNRKIKCLKAGEATITAIDTPATPATEGKFVIKCS